MAWIYGIYLWTLHHNYSEYNIALYQLKWFDVVMLTHPLSVDIIQCFTSYDNKDLNTSPSRDQHFIV